MSDQINVQIGSQEVAIVVEGGSLATGMSKAIGDLNGLVSEANQAALDAEAAAIVAVNATANKLDTDGANATPTLLDNIGAVATVNLAAAGGDDLVGVQTPTGPVRTQGERNSDTLNVRDLGALPTGDAGPALQLALTVASATGIELVWPAGNYSTSIPLSCGAVSVRCTGRVTLTYTGAPHVSYLLQIDPDGSDISLLGSLVLDGANKVNIGLLVESTSGSPNFHLGDVEARNCRMVVGSAFNAGANGIAIRGPYNCVSFDRLWAENITRAAGSGVLAVFGTIGVEIARTGDGAPLKVIGRMIGAKTVTTDDAVGSPACADCDAVAIFQNDVDGSMCSIQMVESINHQGRAIKLQTFRSTHIGAISYKRSIAAITGGTAEVNLQYAQGSIGFIEGEYTGLADTVHGQGTTCISSFTGLDQSARGFGRTSVTDWYIRDLTTGGTAYINQIFGTQNGTASTVDQSAHFGSGQLFGRAARNFVDTGQVGSSGSVRYQIRIDGFMGSLLNALILTNTNPTVAKFRALISNVWNTGTPVPPVKRFDGTPMVYNYGTIVDGGGNLGLLVATEGDSGPALIDNTQSRGSYIEGFSWPYISDGSLLCRTLAAGEEVTLPGYGLIRGTGRVLLGLPGSSGTGLYKTRNGSTTVTTVDAAPDVVTDSTGVEPAGGVVRVWFTANLMHVKNASGSIQYVTARSVG